jgi:hypothetical protein
MTTIKEKEYPILGSFGKGVKGSYHLSFGMSAGKHCLTSCVHYLKDCYAQKTERFRSALGRKQERHENTHPTLLVNKAIMEVQNSKTPIPWFRFSSFGSAPNKPTARGKGFIAAMVRLASLLDPRTTHFPVESKTKAEFYRRILPAFTIRESLQSKNRLQDFDKQCSIVVGKWEQTPKERADVARATAKDIKRTRGKTAVVCPAVVSDSKCGQCRACASPLVDLVVYPLHR